MLRSRARFCRVSWQASLSFALVCCAPTRPPLRTRYAPGQHQTTAHGLTVELAATYFAERKLIVSLALMNGTTHAIELSHDGILLRYEELEYPLAASPIAIPDPIVVARGQQVDVDLQFVLGPVPVHDGTLMLRSVRAGRDWLDPIRLLVPGPAPAAKPEDQDASRGSR